MTYNITVNYPNGEQDYATANLPLQEAIDACIEDHPDWTSLVVVVTRHDISES